MPKDSILEKDSILMHYLDSLVSDEFIEQVDNYVENQPNNNSFFVIENPAGFSLQELLQKKIEIIKKIQDIRLGNPKTAATFFYPFANDSWSLKFLYKAVLKSYINKIAEDRKKDNTIADAESEPISRSYSEEKSDPMVLLEIADKMIFAALLQAAVYRDSNSYLGELRTLEQTLYDLTRKWSAFDERIQVFDSFDYGFKLENYGAIKSNIDKFNQIHTDGNIFRFFIMRIWRFLVVYATRAFAYYKQLLAGIQSMREAGVGDFLSYFTWVFFIPRILINACTFLYSLFGTLSIFGSKQLPKIEDEYGWYLRLKMRLNDIFFEMSSDWMWCVSGAINCFSLAGSLPVIGVYVMVSAQAYDFSAIMLRNYLDGNSLKKLQTNIEKIKNNYNLNDSTSLINNLISRVTADKKQMLYAIFNFALILMCIVLMTPAFGNINPFIPLVACLITVIAAPMRGLTIWHFRKIAQSATRLIDTETTYGFIKLDKKYDESSLSDKNFLGVYNKNFLGVHNRGLIYLTSSSTLYKYDKQENKLEKLDSLSWDKSKIPEDDKLRCDRLQTVDNQFIKQFNVEFSSSGKTTKNSNSNASFRFTY